jgi:hypothetical protein
VVASLLPLVDVFTQPDAYIKVCIQEEDNIGFHALNVEHNRLRLW